MKSKKEKQIEKKIALKRIKTLFKLAKEEFKKHPERSHRYVEIARKIGRRCGVRIPRELKRKFCKKCGKYLFPGINCRVRIGKMRVTITCLECGNIQRYPYVREKKERKKELNEMKKIKKNH